MKSLFSTIILLVFTLMVKSQNNLQFSKVINLTNGDNITVPTGKVWKVESINFSETINFPPGSLDFTGYCNWTYISWQAPSMAYKVTCRYSGIYFSMAGIMFRTPGFDQNYDLPSPDCSVCTAKNTTTFSIGSTTPPFNYKFPIWLESGKSISLLSGSGILISIVEFNVVE